jgi:hypothetical protein
MRNLSNVNEWPESAIWREVFKGASEREPRSLSDGFTLKEIALLTKRSDISVELFNRAVDTLADSWNCDECGELINSVSEGCLNPHCGETPHERAIRESVEEDAENESMENLEAAASILDNLMKS